MKNFKFIHETPSHFVLHNGRAHFHVAKNGIDAPTADKIRALADGGEVKDTDLQDPPQADLDYKAQPLPTPEPEPKRRQIEAEMPEPEGHAHGGKLTAKARAEIPQKNFALPNGRYPIEDASHARNALARVSQHGSSEEKAKVRSKVASKYPGIEQSKADGGEIQNYDDGGQTQAPPVDPDKVQSAQDSMRKAFGYDDGGSVQAPEKSTLEQVGDAIKNAFEGPTPTPQPSPDDREAQYEKTRAQNRANMGYAGGGPVASNAVKDISNETQSQAIGRYAAGNPANLAKGGGVQNHFHFYQGGAPGPSPLDQYEGDVPNPGPASTALDDYTKMAQGGNPPFTPLDDYVRLADGGDTPSVNISAADLDPKTVINPGYNDPTPLEQEMNQASQDQSTPSPEQSANNLAGAMGKSAPFQSDADQAVPSRPEVGNGPVVAPQNQISMTPKGVPPSPGQNVDLLTEFNKNLQGEQSAIKQGAVDQAKAFQDQNDIIKAHLANEEVSRQKYDQDQTENTAQANYLFQQVANNKVDPNRYWNSKSTGGKIAAAIGLILGGASSGLTGRPNPALDVIQNAIREDVAAQRDNQATNMNLYKMGLQKYRDRQAAEDYATLHSNTIAQGMLQQAANRAGSAAAKTSAQFNINKLGLDNIQLRTNLAMQQAALNAMNGPAVKSGLDLNKLNLLKQSGFIPKEDVPDLNKEAADYGKLSNILDTTDSTFNQARQNQTYTERALPGWTPTIRDSSKRYEAATNQWLGNITHETEGRVTPMDVDLMRASLPKAGDPPDLYQTKLNNVKDMIRQKYAFPNLMEKRIISPNDSVAIPSSTRKKRFNESPVK